ncbi:MAG: hypothetical protein AAB489_05165 [Patescibacteria group bacterium]
MVALFRRPASLHQEIYEEHIGVVRDTAETLQRLSPNHLRAQEIRRSLDLFLSDIGRTHQREKSVDASGALEREFIFHRFQTEVASVLSSVRDSDTSSAGGETEGVEGV